MWSTTRSVRWASWFNAWLAGAVSPDDALDAVLADDAAHDILGLEGADTSLSLVLAWGRLRALGASSASVALPAPGDPYGLGGPVDFNIAATDAGEAVILGDVGLGLVPEVVGQGVFWNVWRSTPPPPVASVGEAEHEVRHELLRVGRALVDLDVGAWQPEIREVLSELREASAPLLAPSYPPEAERVAALATRCLRICELALDAGHAALTASAEDERSRHLRDLERSARHALVSACGAVSTT